MRNIILSLIAGVVGIVMVLVLMEWRATPREENTAGVEERFSVASILGAEALEGFARVTAPRPFEFPRDHAAHPDMQIEWWYTTGNLNAQTAAGKLRHFGYELTFFRVRLRPPLKDSRERESQPWSAEQLYMTHFALTDTRAERFLAWDRWDRGALGLAGVAAEPLRVWNGDWEFSQLRSEPEPLFALRAKAQHAEWGEVELRLTLDPAKAKVLQGDRGFSPKGPQVGNASYYYSFTRLRSEGTLQLDGESLAVTGESWFDHEWSTSALGSTLQGWDWFALQLADEADEGSATGTELMLYQLRTADGAMDPYSAGTWIGAAPKGSFEGAESVKLTPDDFEFEALEEWKSPTSGITYPSRWRIAIAAQELELWIEPVIPHQELNLFTVYWEGAVRVTGTRKGERIRGHGYAELVGYE